MGWAAYFLIGLLLVPCIRDEEGGVVARVILTVTMWPLVLFVAIMKA